MLALQVIPDRFTEQATAQASDKYAFRMNGHRVRRPTRGITLKEETFATLRCVAWNGGPVNLIDAGSRMVDQNGQPLEVNGKRATNIYSNFLLQQIGQDRMEKQQILETFGEPYIFLFGERARVMTFQGVLLNTYDFNWEAEWWHNYENYLRGTRCVENDARVFISFDENVIGGYILGAQATKVATDQNYVQFQFQVFVTSDFNFSHLGDPKVLQNPKLQVTSNEDAAPFLPPRQYPIEEAIREYMTAPQAGDEGDLFDAIESGLDTVKAAWKTAQIVASFATKAVANFINGEVVRIPYGFEGAMAYDDAGPVELIKPTYGQALKYTVFSDNEEEYVGSGNHYGTATVAFGAPLLSQDYLQGRLKTGEEQAEAAKKIWEENGGMFIENNKLSPLQAALAGGALGLVAGVAGGAISSAQGLPRGESSPFMAVGGAARKILTFG